MTSRIRRAKRKMASLFSERPGEEIHHPFYGFVHFWVFVVRSFSRNRCPVRATALAYTTLLALVPLLALSLGVTTSLLKSDETQTRRAIEKLIEQVAPQLEQLPGAEAEKLEARQRLTGQIQGFIGGIDSGALGVSGTVALVLVAIGLLITIETSFNDIWDVPRGRTWLSRVIHYWAVITLGPMILALAMGTAVSAQWGDSTSGWAGRVAGNALPFVVLSLLFGLMYQLMPNTRVNWKAALVGGGVGALLWVLNSNFSVVFAARVVSASRIYGSLAVLPVFLIGLYVSWIIVLFGAQVAYAFQNRHACLQEKRSEAISARGREFAAIRVMVIAGDRFQHGEPPATLVELAEGLGVSPRLVTRLVTPLRQARLLIEVSTPDRAYAPCRPPERITLEDILEALRSDGDPELPTLPDQTREALHEAYLGVQRAEKRAAGSVTLRDLLERSGRNGRKVEGDCGLGTGGQVG